VKGSSGDALDPLVPAKCSDATDDFASRSSREREKQDAIRRHAALQQKLHPSAQCGGLAGTRPREDPQRSITEGGGFELALIELLARGVHASDATEGVSYRRDVSNSETKSGAPSRRGRATLVGVIQLCRRLSRVGGGRA